MRSTILLLDIANASGLTAWDQLLAEKPKLVLRGEVSKLKQESHYCLLRSRGLVVPAYTVSQSSIRSTIQLLDIANASGLTDWDQL
jgi:hypothetical protein